jgi:hypothetical protein
MFGWDRYRFNKKQTSTSYAKLVFFHSMLSAGQVVHSDASGVRNIKALFFMVMWDCYRYHKKRARTRYAKLMFWPLVGIAGHVVDTGASGAGNVVRRIFHVQVGLVQIQ